MQKSQLIEVNKTDIEDQMSGLEVVQIRVLQGDEYVNFWVRVGCNKRGRVFTEVASNVGEKCVRKSVTAGALPTVIVF